MSPPEAGAPAAADEAGAEVEGGPRDERRELLVGELRLRLGDAVLDSHVRPGQEAFARVSRHAWAEVAEVAHQALALDFFDFLSAVDWLPSPYGRDMDAQEDAAGGDPAIPAEPAGEAPAIEHGYAGGETRFQLLARLYSTTRHVGVVLKADLPDDDLRAATWSGTYPGADWHEREAWEMFGIEFTGHPGLRHLYLPADFEGHPLRKDFPLLARRVKPWPGIVDVEPMPGGGDGDGDGDGEEAEAEGAA